MKQMSCPLCGEYFFKNGTRTYCENGCYKIGKKIRQGIVDGLVKEIRKGLYANFKLFQVNLPQSGQVQIDYDDALKNGFDENAYYGTFKSKDALWHVVDSYYFLIEHRADKRILHIYKK